MVLEILGVEPIYPQYSGVLETCLALRYWFFEVLGSESVKHLLRYMYSDIDFNNSETLLQLLSRGVQWLSGRVLDSGPRGSLEELHCVLET